MQINDLSVEQVELAEVRGGINNVNVRLIDNSDVDTDQDVRIGGGKKSSTILNSSPVDTFQAVDARRKTSVYMPISDQYSAKRSTVIKNSSFSFGFGGW